MKVLQGVILAAGLAGVSPAFADQEALQRHRTPPTHGPSKERSRTQVRTMPQEEARPHVDESGRWVGHERNEPRFKLERPWPRGRFTGQTGHQHVYRIEGWDGSSQRFWFGRWNWVVAPWELNYSDDWDWSTDQIAIYDDPEHEGWHLAYNVRLGTYVHVRYDGERP